MSTLSIDANFNVTELRETGVVGAFFEPSVAANAWRRLMPSGNSGSVASDSERTVDIGTYPSYLDAQSLVGWELIVLNPGYQQKRAIQGVHGSVLTLKSGIENITSGIQWTVRPPLVSSLILNYSNESADDLTIGYSLDEIYSPRVTELVKLVPGDRCILPLKSVELLFIKFATLSSNPGNKISWGEHYIY